MFRLMLVTDRLATRGRDLVGVVAAACRGGVDCVQLRDGSLPRGERAAYLTRIKAAIDPTVTLLVNGDALLAWEHGVGLHLSCSSDPVEREQPKPFGRSIHSVDEVVQVATQDPDYLIFGNVFETTSHPGHPGQGLIQLRRVVAAAGEVPIVAIGGITLHNACEVTAAGARAVAVRSAILGDDDPEQAARAICDAMG
jgi:thiazole tautomerase (transcriptional regulator TenI)